MLDFFPVSAKGTFVQILSSVNLQILTIFQLSFQKQASPRYIDEKLGGMVSFGIADEYLATI